MLVQRAANSPKLCREGPLPLAERWRSVDHKLSLYGLTTGRENLRENAMYMIRETARGCTDLLAARIARSMYDQSCCCTVQYSTIMYVLYCT